MKKKLTGFAKAEKVWNEQPYLEKLLFLRRKKSKIFPELNEHIKNF